MKPSARNARECRRLLVSCSILLLTGPAPSVRAEEALCRNPTVLDPRLEELAGADADDPAISIESDTGEMERNGNAVLRGNVRIRMGQRLLTADEAEVDAAARSVSMRGQVEFLDPTLRVRGEGGSFAGEGTAEFRGAEFELLDRSVRGAAGEVRMHEEGKLELTDVSYTACPPGNEDWKLRAGELSLNQKTQIGTGRDVRLDIKGVPVLYAPWISFPVGEQRKTGMLFPIIGNSGRYGTHAGGAVVLEHRAEPRRDDHDALLQLPRSASRSAIPLPDRVESRRALRRVPARGYRARRVAQLRRAAARDALPAPHPPAHRRCERQRLDLLRGLRLGLRGHQRHLPQPQAPSCGTTPTTGA